MQVHSVYPSSFHSFERALKTLVSGTTCTRSATDAGPCAKGTCNCSHTLASYRNWPRPLKYMVANNMLRSVLAADPGIRRRRKKEEGLRLGTKDAISAPQPRRKSISTALEIPLMTLVFSSISQISLFSGDVHSNRELQKHAATSSRSCVGPALQAPVKRALQATLHFYRVRRSERHSNTTCMFYVRSISQANLPAQLPSMYRSLGRLQQHRCQQSW